MSELVDIQIGMERILPYIFGIINMYKEYRAVLVKYFRL